MNEQQDRAAAYESDSSWFMINDDSPKFSDSSSFVSLRPWRHLHPEGRSSQALYNLVNEKCRRREAKFSDEERQFIDELFESVPKRGAAESNFKTQHQKAVQATVMAGLFKLGIFLIQKDSANDLFHSASHILHSLLDAPKGGFRGEMHHELSLRRLFDLMVEHGAPLHEVEGQEPTLLYHACASGHVYIFEQLIHHGAKLSGQYPLRNRSSETAAVPEGNLIQVAMEALSRGGQCEDWVKIIKILLSTGLSMDKDSEAATSFLVDICRGDSIVDDRAQVIQMLFSCGVKIAYEALREAVLAGNQDLTELLLSLAADIKPPTFSYKAPRAPDLTLIQAALLRVQDDHDANGGQLEACELLVAAGAPEDAAKLLLEASVKFNKVEMVERLLQRGIRLDNIPLCRHVETVKLLLDTQTPADKKTLQVHAVTKNLVELMKFLVDRHGLLLSPALAVKSQYWKLWEEGRLDMLRYLVTEHHLDVNLPFHNASGSTQSNLLLSVIGRVKWGPHDRRSVESVLATIRCLLEAGADPACSGLSSSPLRVLLDGIVETRPNISRFAAKYLPIINLIQQNETGGSKTSKGDIITLFPPGYDRKAKPMEQGDGKKHGRDSTDRERPQRYSSERPIPHQNIATEASRIALELDGQPLNYDHLCCRDSIRLLQLQPRAMDDDVVQRELIDTSIYFAPDYDVLSGFWGESSTVEVDTAIVVLNGRQCRISSILQAALRKVRTDSTPRYLWIHALCINKRDTWERNQQVTMIRDIIQAAQRLIVWLGNAEDSSASIFQFLATQKEFLSEPIVWPPFDEPYLRIRPSKPARPTPQYQDTVLVAFQKLCLRPWFYRPWSVPEVCLSRAVTLLCGDHQLAADDETFSKLILPYALNYSYQEPGSLYGTLDTTVSPVKLIKSYAMTSSLDFVEACHLIRHFHSEDPRDLIFAIASSQKTAPVAIDYSLSVAEVFRSMAEAVIRSQQSPYILHAAQAAQTRSTNHMLSSWVPDFSSPLLPIQPLLNLPGRRYRRSLGIRGVWWPGKLPVLEFQGSSLIMKGLPMEKISTVGKEMLLDTVQNPDSVAFSAVIREWESLAASLASTGGYTKRFPQSVTDAFADTIVANDARDVDHRPRPIVSEECEKFSLWYREHGTGVLADADPDYFTMVDAAMAWAAYAADSSQDQSRDRDLPNPQDELERYSKRLAASCAGRSFFLTDGGSMGLCLPSAQAGDVLVFFPAANYPLLLREVWQGRFVLVGECFLYDWWSRLLPVIELEGAIESRASVLTEFAIV